MNYLEQYYRNMCEQLQSRLNLLEKQNMDPQVTDPADLSPEEQRQQRVSTQVHNYAKRAGYPTSPVDYGDKGPQRNTRTTPGGTQYEVEPLGKETVKNVYTGDKFAISHSTQGVPDQEEIGPADGPSKDYEPVSTGEDAEAEYKRVQASKTKALKENKNNNMNYLEQYYKNLCEQLQSQIDLLEKRFDISQFNKSKKGGKKDEKKDDKKSGKKADKKANKDYDGDGEVESSKDEYFGSKDKAIKKSIADKKKKKNLKEGREISGGQFTYGGFPRILNEMHDGDIDPNTLQDIEPHELRVTDVDGDGDADVEDVVMRARDGTMYPSVEYARVANASTAAFDAARGADTAVSKFHQNAAKEWGAIFDNAPAYNRAMGNSGRRRAGFADRGRHMEELPHRMLRDPDMRALRDSAAATQAASNVAYEAQRAHPHHAEFMRRAQATSDSVYGTRGNLGS